MMRAMANPPTLIVLRPLELKHLFDFSFRLYRSAFAPMLLAMAMVTLPLSLLTLPLMLGYLQLLGEVQGMSNSGQLPDSAWFFEHTNMLVIGAILLLAAAIYQLLVMPLGRLTCAKLAAQSLLGEPYTFNQALAFARTRYWQTQVSLATYLLPLVLLALVGLLPVLAFTAAGSETGTMGAAVVTFMLIMFGAFATWLFYFRLYSALNGTLQAVEDPEGAGVFAQGLNYLKRAYALTDGYFWRSLGLIILMAFAVGLIQNGINQSISLVAMLGQAFSSGQGNIGKELVHMAESQYDPTATGIQLVVAIVVGLLFPALQLCYEVLMYFDLRCRKEALDLHIVLDELAPPPEPAPVQYG